MKNMKVISKTMISNKMESINCNREKNIQNRMIIMNINSTHFSLKKRKHG